MSAAICRARVISSSLSLCLNRMYRQLMNGTSRPVRRFSSAAARQIANRLVEVAALPVLARSSPAVAPSIEKVTSSMPDRTSRRACSSVNASPLVLVYR